MRLIFASPICFALLAIALPCAAQEKMAAKAFITTTGTATVPVQPDSVRISFGLQVRFTTVKEVRLESEKLTKQINEALSALKIDTLKVTAAGENLQIIQSSNPAGGAAGAETPPVTT